MRPFLLRYGVWVALLLSVLLLSACATISGLVSTSTSDDARWQGRLAIKVFGTPVQAWSANFVLAGSSEEGELTLTTPLGGTIAQMHWSPGHASLQSADKLEYFDNLDTLALQAMGTHLPIAALFDWLEGKDTPVSGWEVDLERMDAGRLTARQTAQEPQSELKIILDR